MSEFGNLALLEERDPDFGNVVAIPLPGVKKGDMAARAFKPEVQVSCIKFSPTGTCHLSVSVQLTVVIEQILRLIMNLGRPLISESQVAVGQLQQPKDYCYIL